MFRYKSILTAAVLAAFMFIGFVQSGNAQILIIDMSISSEIYDYGYIYDSAYIETDTPYKGVDWFIGHPDDGVNLSWVHTTEGDGVATRARFSPSVSGNIKGVKYRVAARPWYYDDNGDGWSDWESRDFRVFQPKIISGTKFPRAVPKNKLGEGIYGSVELTRHYHDGQNIVVDAYLYARNRTKVPLYATSWFRHTRFDANGITLWSVEDPHPSEPLPSGETYSNSGSSMISFPVGGDIGKDQVITLNAHIHLDVGGQVWHEEHGAWTHEFTKDDNQ